MIEQTITDLQKKIVTEEYTAEEIVRYYINRIEKIDEDINSVVRINEEAIDKSKELDRKYESSGLQGPLHGVPIIAKDNICTRKIPTTAGSKSLQDLIPEKDSCIIRRIRKAGGVIIAKANMGEFAKGTKSSIGGQVHNPYSLERTPGGSSAGSGAAIAANLATVGLGTDTGGSIRQPAAFNNVVGIRPTVGLLSRDGIIPVSPTQDTPGPMTRTVEDTAIMLEVLSGYDENDPTTAKSINHVPSNGYTSYLNSHGLRNTRIGVLRDTNCSFFSPDDGEKTFVPNEVSKIIYNSIEHMRELGAIIIDPVVIPNLWEFATDVDANCKGAEFQSSINEFLKSFDDVENNTIKKILESNQYLEEDSVKKRINGISENNESFPKGNIDNNKKYLKCMRNRNKIQKMILDTMAKKNIDALIYPTYSQPPVEIGEKQMGSNTHVASASNFPAISIPAGFTSDPPLPIGIEILGRPFSEPSLIEYAYSYEQATRYRQPPFPDN